MISTPGGLREFRAVRSGGGCPTGTAGSRIPGRTCPAGPDRGADMPLHPQVEAFMRGVESMGLPPFETLSLEEGRATIAALGGFMGPPEDVASVIDTIAPGPEADVPLRIFIPAGEEPPPVIMYFHGGGFSTGSVDIVE